MQHNALIADWENAMRFGLLTGRPFSESCIASYKRYVTGFFKAHTVISVDAVKQALLAIPIEHFAKRLKLYEGIRSYAKHLIDNEILDEAILIKLKKFKPKRHLPLEKFTVDLTGLEQLLTVCQSPLDTIIVELLSQTGLRVSEATSLHVDDIYFEKGYLLVRQAKWGKTRRVGLSPRVQEALKQYLAKRPQSTHPNLLLSHEGLPMKRWGVGRRLNRLGRLADVKVSPHALRRAFVTINANKGRPLVMLQMACGHSDITTTRSYCLTTEDEAIEAMQSWD